MVEEGVKRLAQGPNFAALTTMGKDGMPSTHVMWVDADDEYVLINTEIHRAKFRNVKRDSRVAIAIWDHENPYRYAEVRGQVEGTIGGDEARSHIDTLSEKYMGHAYKNKIESERVLLKIRPARQRSR